MDYTTLGTTDRAAPLPIFLSLLLYLPGSPKIRLPLLTFRSCRRWIQNPIPLVSTIPHVWIQLVFESQLAGLNGKTQDFEAQLYSCSVAAYNSHHSTWFYPVCTSTTCGYYNNDLSLVIFLLPSSGFRHFPCRS